MIVKLTSNDKLFAVMKQELFTAIVGDVMELLDSLRHTPHFLPPQMRPLRDDMVVVGRAITFPNGWG